MAAQETKRGLKRKRTGPLRRRAVASPRMGLRRERLLLSGSKGQFLADGKLALPGLCETCCDVFTASGCSSCHVSALSSGNISTMNSRQSSVVLGDVVTGTTEERYTEYRAARMRLNAPHETAGATEQATRFTYSAFICPICGILLLLLRRAGLSDNCGQVRSREDGRHSCRDQAR